MYNRMLKHVMVVFVMLSTTLFAIPVLRAETLDKVIAVVNDEVVTQREFDRAFEPVKKQIDATEKGAKHDQEIEKARKMMLEQIVNTKLTISLAKKQKLKIDEKELENRLAKIKKFYDSDDAFLKALSDKGMTLSEFKQDIKDQMLAQKLVEKEVSSKIVITPSDIQNLYVKNKARMIAPKRIKLRSILIRKEKNGDNKAAKQKIDKIYAELKKGGDFAAIAKKESEGPYKDKSGEMGYVSKGQMIKVLDDSVMKLKKGELSDIIESNMGYHIFLAEDVKESRPLKLEEVSNFLREQLFMKEFKKKLAKWLEDKRKDAYISYK